VYAFCWNTGRKKRHSFIHLTHKKVSWRLFSKMIEHLTTTLDWAWLGYVYKLTEFRMLRFQRERLRLALLDGIVYTHTRVEIGWKSLCRTKLISSHIDEHAVHNLFQSSKRSSHSNETALARFNHLIVQFLICIRYLCFQSWYLPSFIPLYVVYISPIVVHLSGFN